MRGKKKRRRRRKEREIDMVIETLDIYIRQAPLWKTTMHDDFNDIKEGCMRSHIMPKPRWHLSHTDACPIHARPFCLICLI